MKTMREMNIHIADRLEYELSKMDIEDFLRLTDVEKNTHRKALAKLRIKQIVRNPKVYPDGVTGSLALLLKGK